MELIPELIRAKDTDKIIDCLNSVIDDAPNVTVSESDTFRSLLKVDSGRVAQLTLQAVAELAKNEKNRNSLTNDGLVKLIIPNLRSQDVAAKLQSCRALGNLCFENDPARGMVTADGLKSLIEIIKTTLDSKLISISCGCLMNLLMNNDELQKASLEFKIVDVIEMVLKYNLVDFETNEDCTTHILTILNMVVEHMNDEWLSLGICSVIVDVLRVSTNPEISALCLEILRMQCENDDIKLCLAKKGTCELVYELVEKHGSHVDDEESRSVLKMACDLIVLILTGDESMDLLYDNGNGKVYEQMVFWLNSEDTDLLSTGVLAIGNFARNDSHCIQMVENGLAKKLLGILKYYSSDGDMKVQHALLSTLRNLSIPAENKAKLLEENLVDTLLSMLNVDHSPVEFKLLGTLRMVVDGQEKTAVDLIKRKEFITKLVDWCYNSDHLGVRGEAPRLLAWLIKNCNASDTYPTILAVPNCVKCLVEMMSSMHAVMQNEAMVALCILCANCLPKEQKLSEQLIESEISKNATFIVEKYAEKMEKPTVENLVTLLEQLVKSDRVAGNLRDEGVLKSLSKLKDFDDTKVTDRISKLMGA